MINPIIKKNVKEFVKEVRCKCNRLLMKANISVGCVEIKCKCGEMNYIIGKYGIEKKKNKSDF
jgi:hypothetical protein